eukprot:g5974.t1
MASKVTADNVSLPWPTIGVVGCGTIAAAVIEGLCKIENNPPNKIILCPRNAAKTAKLVKDFPTICNIATSNQDVIDNSQVVIIGLRTQVAKDVLTGLSFKNNKDIQVITLTSVISVNQMAEIIGLPIEKVAKAVPLPAVAHHRGITVTTGTPAINERVFSKLGGCQPVANEEEMRNVQVMTCMMGPIYKFMEVCAEFMIEQNVPNKVASQYVAKCMDTILYDAVQRCPKGKEGFTELVDEQTPGGLNECNISDLQDAGVFDAYKKSLEKTVARLRGTVSLKKDDS